MPSVVRRSCTRSQLGLRYSPDSSLRSHIDDDDIPAAVDQNSHRHCHRGRRAGVSTRSRLLRTCVYQHDLHYNIGRHRPSYCRSTPPLDVFPIRHRNRNRVLVNVDRSRTISSLKVGVLNVRSLGNKSAAVSQQIPDESLDLFATIETPPSHRASLLQLRRNIWSSNARGPASVAKQLL